MTDETTEELTPELAAVRDATAALARALEPCGEEAVPVIIRTLEENGIELPEFVKMAL